MHDQQTHTHKKTPQRNKHISIMRAQVRLARAFARSMSGEPSTASLEGIRPRRNSSCAAAACGSEFSVATAKTCADTNHTGGAGEIPDTRQ